MPKARRLATAVAVALALAGVARAEVSCVLDDADPQVMAQAQHDLEAHLQGFAAKERPEQILKVMDMSRRLVRRTQREITALVAAGDAEGATEGERARWMAEADRLIGVQIHLLLTQRVLAQFAVDLGAIDGQEVAHLVENFEGCTDAESAVFDAKVVVELNALRDGIGR